MASYPGSKVHRRNRRKLGRGQAVAAPTTSVTVTSASADVMKIVSSDPVVWGAAIAATVATLTIVSQTVVSATEVHITFSGAVSTHAYTVPAGAGTNYAGGVTLPASGTF